MTAQPRWMAPLAAAAASRTSLPWERGPRRAAMAARRLEAPPLHPAATSPVGPPLRKAS